jgi:hypothetical protein
MNICAFRIYIIQKIPIKTTGIKDIDVDRRKNSFARYEPKDHGVTGRHAATSFQQIVLTIDEENAEVGCVEPWYEPCEEDPNICVHKRIDPELKAEVCREFAGTNYPKNKIINFPGRTDVRLGRSDRGPGRFKVTAENFPVAHTAGDTTHVPGSDPSEASIPVHQSGFLFETGESSKNAR